MSAEPNKMNRWLHGWAIFTVCAAVPLVTLGAEVTTKHVGMVDPAWPTPPWHLVSQGRAALEAGVGYVIEHGHRLAGWTVGFCVIVMAVGLWLLESRRWLRWLGVAALLGVGLQGLLGGSRVLLNAWYGPDLAMAHGIFGQLVFALLASLVLCTSSNWAEPSEHENEDLPGVRRWSFILVGLVLLQLVLGALLRHKGLPFAQRGHLLAAFAVVAAAAWLIKLIHDSGDRRLGGVARLLAGLLVLQLALGVEAWLVKFATPEPLPPGHWLWSRELVRSGHVLVGSLVLATSVVTCLEAQRRAGWVLGPAPVRGLGETA